MKLRAFYSDIHGCYEELTSLYYMVSSRYSEIEHWHLGDLVDRGPFSGKTIQFVMQNFTGGIKGNHDGAISNLWDRFIDHGTYPANPYKKETIKQMSQKEATYLKELPRLHVFDEAKLVICHGGLYPYIPLYKQVATNDTCRLQMIHKNPYEMLIHSNRWWGSDARCQKKMNMTEEESREQGFRRWYELYDHEYDCIFGHSVLGLHPQIVSYNKGAGRVISLDTGSCFGGFLTALIYPTLEYIRVPCRQYVEGKNVKQFKLLEK